MPQWIRLRTDNTIRYVLKRNQLNKFLYLKLKTINFIDITLREDIGEEQNLNYKRKIITIFFYSFNLQQCPSSYKKRIKKKEKKNIKKISNKY